MTRFSVSSYLLSASIYASIFDSVFLKRRSSHDWAPSIKRSMYYMWSFASTSVSFTFFFNSDISKLSSCCCLATSSLAFFSSSVTFLILKLSSFSSALRSSNSYCFKSSFAISLEKFSYFKSVSSSKSFSVQSTSSFLCFLISRWLPSTSGLSCNCLQSLRVDSFKSLATLY